MLYTIRSDIHRAIFSKGFLLGVFSIVIVIALSSVEEILTVLSNNIYFPVGFHTQIIIDTLRSEPVMFAVPICCALPFTTAFLDDIRSGFIKQFLHRSGLKAYIAAKLAACAISGGFVLAVGVFLAYLIAAALMIPTEAVIIGGTVTTASLTLLLEKICFFFLSGMLWSLVGFTLASITGSRYMAYASPFVFYYGLVILYERYFSSLYWLYPKEWLNPSHFWFLGNWGLVLLLLSLIMVLSGAFAIYARGKLCHV